MFRRIAIIISICLLFFYLQIVFIPPGIWLPEKGLDGSWVLGMNQAVAQGLVFGKDIIFTYGPYASINTKAYHPATYSLMIFGSLYLAFFYTLILIYLTKLKSIGWLVLYCFFLPIISSYSQDPLLLSYPLLLSLFVYLFVFEEKNIHGFNSLNKSIIIFCLLFTPFGLLSLIKGTYLFFSMTMAILCFLLFIFKKKYLLAFICILSPVGSMMLFWIISKQPITGLYSYIINIASITSGYSESMSLIGNAKEIIFYILSTIGILMIIFSENMAPRFLKYFLFFSYFIFLFIAFKAGFVRHDEQHALTSGMSILIAVITVNFVLKHKYMNIVLLLSIFTSVYIFQSYYGSLNMKIINENIMGRYLSSFNELKNGALYKNIFKDNFEEKLKEIKNPQVPLLNGTSDIYSYNLSFLIASGNKWSPRPSIQSYQADTPKLAQLNEMHLRSSLVPDNIIFSIEPIDGRFPSLEDGLSWPTLITHYKLEQLRDNFLFLKKRDVVLPVFKKEIYVGFHNLGETVMLPTIKQGVIFAKINIQPTFFGRIIEFLYKPTQLEVVVTLINGELKTYRMISVMAKSGFLISPLIETTKDFSCLFGNIPYLKKNTIKSFWISTKKGDSLYWKNKYSIKLDNLIF